MKGCIVVTGGGGFVGANLVHRLVKDRSEVHLITRPGSNLWRLDGVKNRIVIHDIGLFNREKLTRLWQKIFPVYVFHLATYGSYPRQKELSAMLETNVAGTARLLESLVEVPYRNFIVVGSSSEYGKKDHPMKEIDVLEPNNFYAATKAAQTHMASVFAKTYHKPLVILRLFNVYGYWEEEGRLVRSVIESVLSGKPILLATGKEARDFIFTEDVVDALLQAAQQGPFEGEVFNIGTGRQTTIKQLAELVIELTGIKVPIRLNAYPGRPWDTAHWVAQMSKTRKMLGWKPKYTLEDGLRKTIAWYRKHL